MAYNKKLSILLSKILFVIFYHKLLETLPAQNEIEVYFVTARFILDCKCLFEYMFQLPPTSSATSMRVRKKNKGNYFKQIIPKELTEDNGTKNS